MPNALNGPQYLGNSLIERGLEQREDAILVPTGPGLGIDLRPEVEAYLSTVCEN